jgi:hypothetical protein
VKRWREDTVWMARAGERAPKSARNVKSPGGGIPRLLRA